jgi:hypothetical protein
VEVVVCTPPEAAAAPRISAAEGLGPLQLWERYCSYQRLPAGAAAAGACLLRQLLVDGSGSGSGGLEEPHRDIEFQAVEVEGYFRRACLPACLLLHLHPRRFLAASACLAGRCRS